MKGLYSAWISTGGGFKAIAKDVTKRAAHAAVMGEVRSSKTPKAQITKLGHVYFAIVGKG